MFEFYRNSDFDANTWANNRSSATKAERTQHIFGATLGGPIVKNKLFFFVDYQGTVLDQPGSTLASVAPAAWRTGDLSSLLPGTVIRDPVTGVAFPNNQIPLSRISPTAIGILNSPDYPLPNREVTGVANNYTGDSLSTTRAHQGDLRLDWNASANDKLFLRFSIAELTIKTEKTAFALIPGGLTEAPFRNLAVNWSHVFNSSLINEVLVGYNSIDNITSLNDWGGIGDANATYGIPGGQPIAGLSSIGWGSGLTSVGSAATIEDNLPKGYQLNEKLTWIKGSHALKFGGQFLRYVQRRYYAGNNGALGLFSYAGTFTGFAFSDFLLDQVSNKGRGGGDPDNPWTHLQNRISLYVQDDFKIRPGPDPEPRPPLGLHLAPRREGQPPVELRRGASLRQRDRRADLRGRTAASRTARSTSPTTRGSSRVSASPGARPTAGSSAAATASPSTWRARAPTCGCP